MGIVVGVIVIKVGAGGRVGTVGDGLLVDPFLEDFPFFFLDFDDGQSSSSVDDTNVGFIVNTAFEEPFFFFFEYFLPFFFDFFEDEHNVLLLGDGDMDRVNGIVGSIVVVVVVKFLELLPFLSFLLSFFFFVFFDDFFSFDFFFDFPFFFLFVFVDDDNDFDDGHNIAVGVVVGEKVGTTRVVAGVNKTSSSLEDLFFLFFLDDL